MTACAQVTSTCIPSAGLHPACCCRRCARPATKKTSRLLAERSAPERGVSVQAHRTYENDQRTVCPDHQSHPLSLAGRACPTAATRVNRRRAGRNAAYTGPRSCLVCSCGALREEEGE